MKAQLIKILSSFKEPIKKKIGLMRVLSKMDSSTVTAHSVFFKEKVTLTPADLAKDSSTALARSRSTKIRK